MRFRYCDEILLEVCKHKLPNIYKRQWSNPNECAAKDLKRTCAFGVVSFVWLLNIYLHDRTEKTCTVSTSRCPIQSLRKVLWGFVWDNGRYLQCTRFPSCHVVYIEVLNCLFNLNLFFQAQLHVIQQKKSTEKYKRSLDSSRYSWRRYIPRAYQQFMYFNQYEIWREGGLGRTSRIKQWGRTVGERQGILRDIRLFPFILCNIPILLPF